MIGRLATAKAALELREARARKAHEARELQKKAPVAAKGVPEPLPPEKPAGGGDKPIVRWPEFTEYACFSCHHDLRDQVWQRRPQAGGTNRNAPEFSMWTFTLTGDLLAAVLPQPNIRPSTKSLQSISTEMAKAAQDPKSVADEAQKLAAAFGQDLDKLASRKLSGAEIVQLIKIFDNGDAWKRTASWDEATQRYLGLVPLCQSWAALDPTQQRDQDSLRTSLKQVRGKLGFLPGDDSPRSFEPAQLRAGH
jgi:hypothetical protein